MKKLLSIIGLLVLWSAFLPAQVMQQGIIHSSSGVLSLPVGWTLVQDTPINCGSLGFLGNNVCIVSSDCTTHTYCIAPTTAGTVWIIDSMTGNTNITITSITGGGGSWTACPSPTCHVFNSGNDDLDAIVNFTGTTATSSYTINMSGNTTGYWWSSFIELLPPPGYTASFDSVATNSSNSCNVCTGAAPTVTATDAVVQLIDFSQAFISWNAFSAPYITDTVPNGISLNTTSGSAPSFTQSTTEGGTGPVYQSFAAIAFKSTAGTFTGPSSDFSLTNYSQPEDGGTVSCAPTCTLTVPSTAGSKLLFVAESNATSGDTHISSMSGCGTWVIPTGCRAEQATANANTSCAYVLSDSSSCTSISLTYNQNASNVCFAVYEVSKASGSFTFDTVDAAITSANATGLVPGRPLTLSGSNDVVFQGIETTGGILVPTLYPWNYNIQGWSGGKYCGGGGGGAVGMLMNTTTAPAPTWIYPEEPGATSAVFGIAFK